jgi:GntR family transcriptional regulator
MRLTGSDPKREETGQAKLLALPVDKTAPTPIYVQIAEGIQALLRAGALPVGTALPPERVLSEQYRVSRMTVHQGYDLLERQGLIECQRGRGTFVSAGRLRKQQQVARSFTEEITAHGATPSSKVLLFHVTPQNSAAKEFFNLPDQELLYEIQRVRFSDAVPLALESALIPHYLCPNLERFNLATQSLYRVLEEEYGLKLSYCIEEISAVLPDRAHRKYLALPSSAAILLVQRRTYTDNETPLELDTSAFRGDLRSSIVRSVRG